MSPAMSMPPTFPDDIVDNSTMLLPRLDESSQMREKENEVLRLRRHRQSLNRKQQRMSYDYGSYHEGLSPYPKTAQGKVEWTHSDNDDHSIDGGIRMSSPSNAFNPIDDDGHHQGFEGDPENQLFLNHPQAVNKVVRDSDAQKVDSVVEWVESQTAKVSIEVDKQHHGTHDAVSYDSETDRDLVDSVGDGAPEQHQRKQLFGPVTRDDGLLRDPIPVFECDSIKHDALDVETLLERSDWLCGKIGGFSAVLPPSASLSPIVPWDTGTVEGGNGRLFTTGEAIVDDPLFSREVVDVIGAVGTPVHSLGVHSFPLFIESSPVGSSDQRPTTSLSKMLKNPDLSSSASDALYLQPIPPVSISDASVVDRFPWPSSSDSAAATSNGIDASKSTATEAPEKREDDGKQRAEDLKSIDRQKAGMDVNTTERRRGANQWKPQSIERSTIPGTSITIMSPLRAILLTMTMTEQIKCRRIQDLILLTQNQTQLHAMLQDVLDYLNTFPFQEQIGFFCLKQLLLCHSEVVVAWMSAPLAIERLFASNRHDSFGADYVLLLLTYKSKYVSSKHSRRSTSYELSTLLRLCQSRSSVNDPRVIPHSLLRDWICRICLDIPSARVTQPTILDLCLSWINDANASLKQKEPVFYLLKDELYRLGLPGRGECWFLSALFEIIMDRRCSRDLQHVVGLIPRDRLTPVIAHLFNSSDWSPGHILHLWRCLCLYVWAPESPPSFVRAMSEGYGNLAVPFYDLMLSFVQACLHYRPNKLAVDSVLKKGAFDCEGGHLRHRTPLSVVRLSLLEGCLRILAAKASSPLNAQDTLQLLTHVLISGYEPVLRRRNAFFAVRSLIPFLERLKFLWTSTRSISRPAVAFLVNISQLLNKVVSENYTNMSTGSDRKSADTDDVPQDCQPSPSSYNSPESHLTMVERHPPLFEKDTVVAGAFNPWKSFCSTYTCQRSRPSASGSSYRSEESNDVEASSALHPSRRCSVESKLPTSKRCCLATDDYTRGQPFCPINFMPVKYLRNTQRCTVPIPSSTAICEFHRASSVSPCASPLPHSLEQLNPLQTPAKFRDSNLNADFPPVAPPTPCSPVSSADSPAVAPPFLCTPVNSADCPSATPPLSYSASSIPVSSADSPAVAPPFLCTPVNSADCPLVAPPLSSSASSIPVSSANSSIVAPVPSSAPCSLISSDPLNAAVLSVMTTALTAATQLLLQRDPFPVNVSPHRTVQSVTDHIGSAPSSVYYDSSIQNSKQQQQIPGPFCYNDHLSDHSRVDPAINATERPRIQSSCQSEQQGVQWPRQYDAFAISDHDGMSQLVMSQTKPLHQMPNDLPSSQPMFQTDFSQRTDSNLRLSQLIMSQTNRFHQASNDSASSQLIMSQIEPFHRPTNDLSPFNNHSKSTVASLRPQTNYYPNYFSPPEQIKSDRFRKSSILSIASDPAAFLPLNLALTSRVTVNNGCPYQQSAASHVPTFDSCRTNAVYPIKSEQHYLQLPFPFKRYVQFEFRQPKIGLKNLGNTCYLNAFLQALFVCNAFVANLFRFQLESRSSDGSNNDVLTEMQMLFGKMLGTKRSVVSPKHFLETLPDFFRDGRQHDSSEVARHIFVSLGGHSQTFIKTVFAGQLVTKNECLICKTIRQSSEVISDIGFPIPTEAEYEKLQQKNPHMTITVQSLFSQFLQCEWLEGENAYSCETCNQKVKACRWTEIASPPAHLFVVLNRFSWDSTLGGRRKEKTPVTIELTVTVWGLEYQLYAVVMHQGATADSGHYYTFACRSEPMNYQSLSTPSKWFRLNDSTVTEEPSYNTINQVTTDPDKEDHHPYILFYRCSSASLSPPVLVSPSLIKALRRRDKKASR